MTKFLLIVFLCLLPFGIMADSQAQQPEPQQTEQQEFENMGDQLLTEFLTYHNRYTPQVVMQRCELDPNWKLLGVQDASGFRWIMVQLPGGVLSLGYTGNTIQPQVMTFIPATQIFVGKSVQEAVEGLRADATNQFKREPDRVIGNSIVYKLTKDISTTIFVAPDGTYAVGTGFNKYLNLPELEDA